MPAHPGNEAPDAAQAYALEMQGVTLAVGEREILRDVSMRLPRGGFIGILGPNGAGKTTLLRAMLGLVQPKKGVLQVLGLPPRLARARLGYMPQSAAKLGGLNIAGWDFVVAAASPERRWPLGMPTRGERDDVAHAIGQAGAAAYAGRPMRTLSGGERQRLLLAQALLGRPEMLLLDEPLSSLDPHYQAATIALVRDLQKRLRLTVFFTAHELNTLLPVLDCVLYLGQGQAACGTVAEVIRPDVLSRLYATKIDVIEAGGQVFVMADGHAIERDTHAHL